MSLTHTQARKQDCWSVELWSTPAAPSPSVPATPSYHCRLHLSLLNATAMASILHTCQGSRPLDPFQDWPPHFADQVLSFHTSICPSLCLSIHPTAPSIDASITSYRSLSWRDDPLSHLCSVDSIIRALTLRSHTSLKPSLSTTLAPAVRQ